MKEYLLKTEDGKWIYSNTGESFSYVEKIEIPDGAERFTDGGFFRDKLTWFRRASKEWIHRDEGWCGYNEVLWQREPKYKEFLNANDNYNLVMLPEYAGDDERSGLIEVPDNMNYAYYTTQGIRFTSQDTSYFYGGCLWQRYTQPESLPFVDDEVQSINDQYAEIEQVRQQTIDATLAERQSTYGSFEDVAFVTENIINVLKKCNYDYMPHAHKMALYMIASKMARIVNGDFNHLDSWHDIGGYAKLIENLIKENNNG